VWEAIDLPGKLCQTHPHVLPEPFGIGLMLETNDEVSRPAESHRQALSEPDVRLSPHPAPIVQPYPCSSRQWANNDGCRRAMRASHCCVRRR
jgi:hypothetical protein